MPEQINQGIEEVAKISERAALALPWALSIAALAQPMLGEVLLGLATSGLSYNYFQIGLNRFKTDGSKRAACLVSQGISQEYISIISGTKGQVANFFTERSVRVDYIHQATRGDFRRILEDPKYQHIALIGHGNGSSWTAKDGSVNYGDLDYIMERHQLPKKKGYFLQVTCGLPGAVPLGRSVVEDLRKVLGYKDLQGIGDGITNLFRPDMGLEPLL